ncbi:MAG TPA: branched-chain amino acid ABC transporter permease [Candidatus Dormibacteraeota bacterium]|nr:branched-chain amino acid ABC transporter permease [Candidatus Dormibacteraeota bacterium]
MSQFLQAAAYGLVQGGLLALVAIGFSLVWGVMNVINLSHGALAITGAYLAWALNQRLGLDPTVAIPIVALAMFGFGYVIQRGLINLVINAPIFLTLLLTFGLNLVILNTLQWVFTADDRTIDTTYASQSFAIETVNIPYGRLASFLLALTITFALATVMTRTRLGHAIGATGMDRGAARLMGIRARHIYAVTFGLAAALAGVAGTMIATVGSFNPTTTPGQLTLDAFVISVLGGLGNTYGALVGGLVLGVAQSLGGLILTGSWVNAIAMAVLIVTLIIRPSGLIGKAQYSGRVEV